MHRFAVWLVLLGSAGCGSWQRVGSESRPSPEQTLTQILDLSAVYRRLGRLAAGPPLPFVGSVSFVAAPADSVIAIVGISLENRALVFQREDKTFTARYRVEIAFQREGQAAVQVARDEVVRVASFGETTRADESVIFQQTLYLTPGSYHVVVTLRDRATSDPSRAEGDFTAPQFRPGSVSEPLLVYEVRSRQRLSDSLSMILNPRGTVAYGGDTLLAYVEGYRFSGPVSVPVELQNEEDSAVVRDSLRFDGRTEVEGRFLRVAPDSLPLGELKLVVGEGSDRRQKSALVSVSEAWVITNYEEMLSLLRYFGQDNRLSALRKAPPSERPALWREFLAATDPDKSTPENEALNQYFSRLAQANLRFRDEGVEGWRTDRGEVFITLGEPDETFDASPTSQGRVIRWTYTNERLTVFFQDETGFGRFRLTPSSRAEYERTLARLRRQAAS